MVEETTDSVDIDALVETNLRGVADARLRKLSDTALRTLHARMRDKLGETAPPPVAEDATADELVPAILKMKRALAPSKEPAPAPAKQKETEENNAPEPTPEERLRQAADRWRLMSYGLNKQCAALSFVYTQDDDLPSPVLAPRRIKICSFNAYKLRLSNPKRKPDGTGKK